MVPTSLLDLQVGHKRGASPDSVSGEVEHKSGEAEYGKYSAKTDNKCSTKTERRLNLNLSCSFGLFLIKSTRLLGNWAHSSVG